MLRHLKVLIVEDNAANRLAIQAQLSDDHKITIVESRSIAEALELIESEKFDVVLLDLTLPDARDLEALIAVREKAPTVPVVVLTAADVSLETVAMKLGAQDFLEKPVIEPKVLISAIRKAAIRQEVAEMFAPAKASLESTQKALDDFDRLKDVASDAINGAKEQK